MLRLRAGFQPARDSNDNPIASTWSSWFQWENELLPPPPPPAVIQKAAPIGNQQLWLTSKDYPEAALLAREEGTVAFRLDIDDAAKVVSCTVTATSGSASLDAQTCKVLLLRAAFSPARLSNGINAPSSWSSQFTWTLPD